MTVYETQLSLPLLARGKVRDIYVAAPDQLLLVASDRLSAFDVVFPDPIPGKGEVLNRLSAYWFGKTEHITANHLITADSGEIAAVAEIPELAGRCSLCVRARPFPVECVVRGYLEGSAWTDYQSTGMVSGISLPAGLRRRQKFNTPLFTPSTKSESGHDEPISFEEAAALIGQAAANQLRRISLELYHFAHDALLKKEIILSDTKFEFGERDGSIILIDEALTPDSSRFWETDGYISGGEARSRDKQFVRDYVETLGWDKQPPAPALPAEVINGMTRRYVEIFERITDSSFTDRENNR